VLALFAGAHSGLRFVGRTGLFKIGEDFVTVAFWTHVRAFGQHTLHFIRVFDDLIFSGFHFGARCGFGEVNFLSTNLGFEVGWTVVATLVICA
jgi:hypothetical protein